MKFLHITTLVGAALALPSELTPRQQSCTSPKLRKSWAKATTTEKQAYIKAVLCLATKPSRLKVATHKTLYDDFGYVHTQLSAGVQPVDKIHGNSAFLPWHRYFVQVYEKALQDCGYTGTAMYWDWVADSSNPTQAAVFDPVIGFGTNGNWSERASNNGFPPLRDGAFKGLKPTYWNNEVLPHTLSRMWDLNGGVGGLGSPGYTPESMNYVNNETTYDGFRNVLENGPHASVHFGVGGPAGDMGMQNASPNDPLFFLHHTQVDRIWWIWQQANPGARTNAYNGNGPDGNPVSLNNLMPMLGLATDKAVKDVMDLKGGFLCYKY